MLDIVRTAQYFKVQGSNKPGEGARYLRLLDEDGVNLLALFGFPKNRRAQIDFVPSGPGAFKALAKKAKWKVQGPKTCLVVEGKDRVGAFVEHAEKLAASKLNSHAEVAVCGGSVWLHHLVQSRRVIRLLTSTNNFNSDKGEIFQ